VKRPIIQRSGTTITTSHGDLRASADWEKYRTAATGSPRYRNAPSERLTGSLGGKKARTATRRRPKAIVASRRGGDGALEVVESPRAIATSRTDGTTKKKRYVTGRSLTTLFGT
jgi:hypothetical protein